MKNHGNKKIQTQTRISIQAQVDTILSCYLSGQAHRFVVFRLGLDVCAKCRKPRKEHLPEDKGRGRRA